MKKMYLTEEACLSSGVVRIPTSDGLDSICVLNGSWYQACAQDDNGNDYTVYWVMLDSYDPNFCEDESCACDWSNPSYVLSDNMDVSNLVSLQIA